MKYKIGNYIVDAKTPESAANAVKLIRTNDATRHEVIVYANQILNEMGKNNSIGKYDKVVYGLASLYGEGFLSGGDLKKKLREAMPRMLAKYGLNDSTKDAGYLVPVLRIREGALVELDGPGDNYLVTAKYDDEDVLNRTFFLKSEKTGKVIEITRPLASRMRVIHDSTKDA